MNKPTFALIGAAGYIAPRHMKAIKSVGGDLVAAMDVNDSVGILDRYFPECSFFKSFERFERHISKLVLEDEQPDYLVVCSPNHLHDTHCRFGLTNNMDIICEKPVVLNPWNLENLLKAEKSSKGKIWNIMQLRLHPKMLELKTQLKESEHRPKENLHEVKLNYITPRGPWYNISWKGDKNKSGGITTNIGVHLFDILIYFFGDVRESKVELMTKTKTKGTLMFENAKVEWFLSIDKDDLKTYNIETGQTTYRELSINGNKIDFTEGFENLHTLSYNKILSGDGFGLGTVKSTIDLISKLRRYNS